MDRRLLIWVASLSLSVAASGQPTAGGIKGSVKDEQGGVLPGASVTLSGAASRTAVSGADGGYHFDNLPPGNYKVSVQLQGFKPQEQTAAVASGAAVEISFTLALGALRGEEVTVTASKVETEVVNAPATVSVLTNEQILTSPAQNYGDLLRTVPGVNVIQTSARDFNVTAREATSTLSNSQLALLDGRTIYLDFFGLILWDFVPTDTAEIKQIEVVRGPASAVWGANALTGVVNIITKSPRESAGGSVDLNGGIFSRACDHCSETSTGQSFGGSFRYAAAPNDRWSWKLAAGYFDSDPYSRPTGQIPVITDPRDPTQTVGGGFYPIDAPVTSPSELGTHWQNQGTKQPRVDLRVDQELSDGGTISYQGGYSGTEGIVHTGIGPFQIQNGSYLAYGRVGYTKRAFKLQVFGNFLDADAPALMAVDATTGSALQFTFKTQTYDIEVGNSNAFGGKQLLTYGGNYRRNDFDISLAPTAENRNEFGAYAQYEYLADHFRLSLGGRVDKFGNLDDPFFSPRVALILKPAREHSIRLSFNRAFRSPSAINNYLNTAIVQPVDLSKIAPLLPLFGLDPKAYLPVLQNYPLVVHAIGSEIPLNGQPQTALTAQSLNAYEVGYTGTFGGRTTLTAAFYINDENNDINFTQLPNNADPYTAQNPPPGWTQLGLPPQLLAVLAGLPPQLGGPVFIPRTAYDYLNLGPTREKGVELGIDHAFNRVWSAYANYSYQAKPEVRSVGPGEKPFPSGELAFPPTNRFNAGLTWNARRLLGSATLNYSDKAFWSDVLGRSFAGYTDSYTMLNASFGVRWLGNKLTTTLKGINLLNQDIQQHLFGDVLKRSVVLDVRYNF